MKSDEIRTTKAAKGWWPSSSVQYLPKQNVIFYSTQDDQCIRMRLYESEAPYAFINQFTVQKIGKLGPVVMYDMREEKD